MKPRILHAVTTFNIGDIPRHNLVSYNEKDQPILFMDAELNYDDLKILVDNNDGILQHITDTKIHWSSADRRDYATLKDSVNKHLGNSDIHVTIEDKNKWNAMETPEEAQLKVNAVIELLDIHASNMDLHITKREKDRWNNTYTREEVSNLLSSVVTNIAWKAPVDTFDSIEQMYPRPQPGWVVTTKDTSITYIYQKDYFDPETGVIKDAWVPWTISMMPDATTTIGGKMSPEMVVKLNSIEAGANYYIHPDTPYCRHVTDTEKKLWNNKASKDLATIFSPGLLSSADKEKLDTIEKYANSYDLPEEIEANRIATDDQHMFISKAELDKLANAVTAELADDEHDGLMSKENFLKLYNIEAGANRYVHPAKHSATDIAQDTLHRYVTDSQIYNWDSKETVVESQYKADKAERNAKEYTDKRFRDLIGAAPEALDTLEEISNALNNNQDFASIITLELTNKVGYQEFDDHINNTSSHLSIIDRAKFNNIQENANYYLHPDFHPATMINTDPDHLFVTSTEKSEWNNKANGDAATETKMGQMTPEMVKKLNNLTTTGMVTSDWNETNENSGSFIRNKPKSLPADGGDADTISNYTIDEITNAKKSATIIIGSDSGGITDKDVDIYCNHLASSDFISTALEQLSEGGTLLFREGTYGINKPINIEKNNITFKASGRVVFAVQSALDVMVVGADCTGLKIDGISFISSGNSTKSRKSQLGQMQIDDSSVTDCIFSGFGGPLCIYGSNNRIINCTFDDMSNTALLIMPSGSSSQYNNIISGNHFSRIGYCAIVISGGNDEEVYMNNNIVSNNTFMDCFNGIRIESPCMKNNCNNNLITGNIMMRGTGLSSDYLYEQHTVRICNGSWNLVTGNVLKGREAANNSNDTNVISNNVSV